MARLPRFIQPWITYVTGKPLPGEMSSWCLPPAFRVGIVAVSYFGQLAGAVWILSSASSPLAWLVLPLSWFWSMACLRRFQQVYTHHASHGRLLRSRRLGEVVADLLNTVALTQSTARFREPHTRHHGRRDFCASGDQGRQFMELCGFHAGMRREDAWRRLFRIVVSPRFHFLFLVHRIRANLIECGWMRRSGAISWLAALTLMMVFASPGVVLLTAFLPLVWLYQVTSVVNTVTEHAWFSRRSAQETMDEYALRCWARFCGEPCPVPQRTAVATARAWLAWAARMLLIHVPSRLIILVSDTPAHDWHHFGATASDIPTWHRAIYLRQLAADAARDGHLYRREFWGLREIIDHAFTMMENAQAGVVADSCGDAPRPGDEKCLRGIY